jgi:alpha-mannosidase
MGERFRDVKDLAEAITRKSLQSIVAKIDCSSLSERETALVVFNSAAFPRDAVVDVVIDIPSTYFTGDGIFAQMGGFISLKQLTVSDSSGHPVPLQVHDQWEELVFGYRKFGAHFSQPMRRFKAAFEASAIPAMGYRSFRAGFKERFDRPRETLSPEPNRMENVHMRVQINGDGTLDIFDKSTKRMYPRQHYFLDEAEMGNALRHVAPGDEGTISSLGEPATVTLVCAGPLCATFRVERVWMLPAEIDASLRVWPPQVGQWIEPCRPHRSKRRVPMQIVTEITLRKDSRVLEFSTTIDNNVRDHRLRLVFPTGLNPSVHVADSPFDVVERLVARPDASGWREDALSQWPMTSWIDVCEGNQGVAFLHRWVGEYEVFDNRCGTLAITLLRCFSCPGGLGETYPAQQLAQCPGKHTFEYAFFPHAGNWREAEVPRIAEDFRVPMRIAQTSRHPGSAPFDHFSFVSVEPAALFRVTALKAAEDGLGYILRGFSHAEKPIAATIRFAVPVSRVEKVSLEEVAMDILETSEGGTCVTLDVHPGEIASIRIIP